MVKRINLALQGGGAHGAFTWGALDRLLEEDDLEIAAITGTSAGALNGAAFKSGMVAGGREGAKRNLDALWAQMGAVGDLRLTSWMTGLNNASMTHALNFAVSIAPVLDTLSQITSPYAYGPFYSNPLRSVVDRFDFERVCDNAGPELFVCATAVRTGKVRVFSGTEISTDAILASACLPTLFQAIEIEDPETGELEPYWDGGYTGNPALFPLFTDGLPEDVVVVNINPLRRDDLPVTPHEIQNRINEISFNSSLLRELRAISFVQRLLEDGTLERGRMKRVRAHMIADDGLMNELSVATKMLPIPSVLHRLKAAGRAAAERFIENHKQDINVRQTLDIREMFS